MGILDIPVIDPIFKKPTGLLVPGRDLQIASPVVMGHYDMSKLTGATSSSVSRVVDQSGNGHDLTQFVTADQPTIATGPNSLPVVAFQSGSWLQRLANDPGWMAPVTLAQPLSIACVFKANAPGGAPTATRNLLTATSGSTFSLYLDSIRGSLGAAAGSSFAMGPRVDDGNWHVAVQVLGATYYALFLDGYMVGLGSTQVQGANGLTGWALGATGAGANPFNGSVGELILMNGALNHQQANAISSTLGAKWGITTGAPSMPSPFQDTVDANGTAIRVWEPANLQAGAPLIISSHQAGGTQSISPSALSVFYALIQAANAQGWRVVASNMHGDSWGNPQALTDNAAAYTFMNARQAVTKVMNMGESMGGVAAAKAIPDGRIPNIKGCLMIDTVTNLSDVYTPTGGFTNFSAAINTAYSVASYASLPAGSDPQTVAASAFTGVRWRFYSTINDATVINHTNQYDLFATKVAAAPEAGIVTKYDAHLGTDSSQCADFVAYGKRCFV